MNSWFSPVPDVTYCVLLQTHGTLYDSCAGSVDYLTASLISDDPTASGGGLRLIYTNGQSCQTLGNRIAIFNLLCDRSRVVRYLLYFIYFGRLETPYFFL